MRLAFAEPPFHTIFKLLKWSSVASNRIVWSSTALCIHGPTMLLTRGGGAVPLSPVESPTFVPFIEEMAYMLDSTPTSPGDILVPAGFYGDRLHIVLSGKVTIPQVRRRQATAHRRCVECGRGHRAHR